MNEFVRYHLPVITAIFVAAAALAVVTPAQSTPFLEFIEKRLNAKTSKKSSKSKKKFESVCAFDTDLLARRVLTDYGSMFVAVEGVRLPPNCIFEDSDAVEDYQDDLDIDKHRFGSIDIELQRPALEALKKALDEAAKLRLSITPLDGAIAGRRSYGDTVRIWNSRFHRALDHWSARGRINSEDAAKARKASVIEQIRFVVDREKEGLYFSTNFSKSIFYSVAPPGTSQHLSLLAFDVAESRDPAVRQILNKNGWYQTIRSDQPHFTFLGVPEDQLPSRGLQKVVHNGNSYWIPKLEQEPQRRVTDREAAR